VEAAAEHAVPGRLNPLAAQHAENDHKRVQKVGEVPAWYFVAKVHLVVVASKHLTRHHNDKFDDKTLATKVVGY